MAFTTVSNEMCNVFKFLGYWPINNYGTLTRLLGRTPTLLDQCCYRGYLDAARRISRLPGAHRTNFIINTINAITTFVNGLRGIKTQPDFDTAFYKLCNGIINIGGAHLTFGCAQKIVNMTLKYVYNEIRLGNTVVNPAVDAYIINTACDFFHMPIDSIVLCILHYVPVNFHTRILLRNNTWTYNKNPWSFLDYTNYIQFVTDLRANLMTRIKPLEAEYHTWGNPDPTSLKGRIYI